MGVNTTAGAGTFYYAASIQEYYFPSLSVMEDSQAFANNNSLTAIHFSVTNQAAIEASTGYATLWGRGAGNATVYFDK